MVLSVSAMFVFSPAGRVNGTDNGQRTVEDSGQDVLPAVMGTRLRNGQWEKRGWTAAGTE